MDIAAISAEMHAYLEAHLNTERFMGSVLVGHSHEGVLWSDGYGMANLEHRVPNTPKTKFRLGSITKQFTAAAILQLQERNLLQVDAPVSTYLSDYPNGDRFSVHQLLNHTAGIPNYTDLPDYWEKIRIPATLDEAIARFKDLPLQFTPGERYSYSNSGYILLTKIIEQVSGQSYAEYLREHIFSPLGMADSGYDKHREVLSHRASGYEFTGDRYLNAEFIDMSVPVGAGGLYSTAEDLYKWSQALSTNTLLSESSRNAMFAQTVAIDPTEDSSEYYGYGWAIANYSGRRCCFHAGGINGFSAMISRYPDDRLTVIVLSNVQNAPSTRIAFDLAAIAFGETYELPKIPQVIQVDPALYERYVGRYELAPEYIFTISTESGRLFAQLTGQDKYEIYPESETEFFYKVVDARISFTLDKRGATSLILHQGGRDMPAPKLD